MYCIIKCININYIFIFLNIDILNTFNIKAVFMIKSGSFVTKQRKNEEPRNFRL